MRLRHTALAFANRMIPAALFFSPKLPTYYAGAVVWPSRENWNTIFSRYEPHMALALKKHLRRGATFWDIGANVGWFSLFAFSIVGSRGHIISFEPAPEVFRLLAQNTAGLPNVTVVQCGVGNADETASFAAQGTSSSSSFVKEITQINASYMPDTPVESISVPIKRIDTLVREVGSAPDVIKIDVEGYELKVLQGAVELLSSRNPTLIIEIHPRQLGLSGGSEDELFTLLKRHSYKWQVIDVNPNSLYTIIANRLG
jgi:FkbM family methyltransferase